MWQLPRIKVAIAIDHIHNNRHVGFDIIMQISHVVCQGANIKNDAVSQKIGWSK